MYRKLKDSFKIAVGTFLLVASVKYFILPYKILSGGVAGIAVLFDPFLHVNTEVIANCLVILLLLVGWLFLGNETLMKTIGSSVLYPIFMSLLNYFPIDIQIDPILASFYAGIIGGIGLGIVFTTGASTGGMDIPPLILHKWTGIKVSVFILITDAITVLLGIMVYGISASLVGLISVFSCTWAIENTIKVWQGSRAKSVQIISQEWLAIKVKIDERLSRGVTIMNAFGGFQHEPKTILLCVVSSNQYRILMEIIKEVDPKAFVITTDASDMHGEGFTYTSPNI